MSKKTRVAAEEKWSLRDKKAENKMSIKMVSEKQRA